MKRIKRFIKNIAWFVIGVGIKIYSSIAHLFIDKNKVLFISFGGKQYSDNPKAISEELHRLRPDTKIVWLLKEPKKFKGVVPEYVKVKKCTRVARIHHLSTALVWVDNDYLVYKPKVDKHPKQLYIETWHGDRGLKKCFFDVEGYERKRPFSINIKDYCDYFLVGSTFAEKTVRSMFRYDGNLLSCGYPRNDILFEKDKEKFDALKAKLGVEKDTKILLYAPTFRANIDEKSALNIDFKRVIETLEKRDSKKWTVVLRVHHRGVDNEYNVPVVDGNNGFDMSELLYVSDMLITDYSSCVGDFILTKRPVVLYATDYQDYKDLDRGVHFDIEKWPFMMAKNNDELNELLANLTEKKAKESSEGLLELYGCYEKGTATKEVCDIIIKKLDGEK